MTPGQLSVAKALKARAALAGSAETESVGTGTSGTALVPPVRCDPPVRCE